MPDRLRLGFAIVFVASLFFFVPVLTARVIPVPNLVGVALLAVGSGLAAWAGGERRSLLAAGLGIAFLGTVAFYINDLGRLDEPDLFGGHVFMIGLAVAFVGVTAARARVGRPAGFALAALGATIWIYGDRAGGLAGEPGNVLTALGFAMAASARP